MSVMKNKKILICVTGSIAAYKACEIVRILRKEDADVQVMLSESAQEFVGKATFAALTNQAVITSLFPDSPSAGLEHINHAEELDAIIVCPATANILCKAATGVADDVISTTLSVCEQPTLFVPAMNFRMWRNPGTVDAVNKSKLYNISDIPYIPIRLFKYFDLLSINKKQVIKTLHSSGTSNSSLSKIYLDKKNASNQIKVLQKIFSHFLGNERLPMLIVDVKPSKIDRIRLNARTAAINGFSIFGKDHTFLLKNEKEINYKALNKFLKKKLYYAQNFTSNFWDFIEYMFKIRPKYVFYLTILPAT